MGNPMKKAAAFLRNGKIFLHPYSRTTRGLWIFSTPVLVASESDQDIGGQLLRALSKSAENVVHPATWKGLTNLLLKAAGMRSFDAFAKSAIGLDICCAEGNVTLIPTKNGDPGNAFLHLNDKAIKCEASEGKLADALRAAFDACE
jgi:hypothetical protein